MILLSVTGYNPLQHYDNMPFLADLFMSDEKNNNGATPKSPKSMGDDWGSGFGAGRTKLFESTKDFDIYCDRERDVNYIFHGPELGCTIDHLEYDPETCHVTVVTNDRQRLDLGARIQWLVRPYIAKEQDLFIIRTENGEAIDGVEVPLKIKEPEITKTVN
ncbi:MAG: hypothetical protein KAJ29_01665 [Alphaproteobacteria bacterium]|nr:hypothetical protein [Alphaproteobacteria bacterium]